ncbi:MAG: DUF126 domain-containing protein [Spirochaetaceae bacterium]|jgi:predicted aconitase with swiveling domain|nr:DUF126 domain-containing protein [Spirochaetaceae bacterium]
MKQFKGRIIVPLPAVQTGAGAESSGSGGSVLRAEALVSRQGFNTLASFQKALMFKDKTAVCSDQNNRDLYGKPMAGKALCMPQTIGSTTGGMVLFCAAALESQPACLLFSRPIDSLAAAGAILAGVWTEHPMPTIDSLGEEFLAAVQSGAAVTVAQDGTVTVE